MQVRSLRAITAAGIALVTVFAVSACTTGSPTTSATPSVAPTVSASAQPAPSTPPVPTLSPLLSADENLDYFNLIGTQVVAKNAAAGGRDFIDALVAGGFDRAAMQVTNDKTAIGLDAGSVQWSVLLNGGCLVGEYGPKSAGLHGIVTEPTGQGVCLIGQTRPIDW